MKGVSTLRIFLGYVRYVFKKPGTLVDPMIFCCLSDRKRENAKVLVMRVFLIFRKGREEYLGKPSVERETNQILEHRTETNKKSPQNKNYRVLKGGCPRGGVPGEP